MRRFRSPLQMLALFAVVALLLTGIALVIEWRSSPSDVAPVQAGPVSRQQPSLLVDVAWLNERLAGDTPPVVVDLNDHEAYAREHIPGAIHAWWQDGVDPFADTYGSALRIADNPFTLPAFAPELGATTDETIVVYDDSASEHAAWFVWRLRAHGYANAVVLDGGLAAWKGAGYPTSTEASLPKEVATPVPSWDTAYWDETADITTEELAGRLDDPNLVVIDVRTEEQQRDTVNDTMPLGRIPGSRSLPSTAVMREDGTFASPEELTAILAPLQLAPENEIVVYGRFGIDTGRVWLALRLAGYENVRVYDPGWQGWTMDPARPIEPLP